MFNIKSYYSLREAIYYILKTCKKYNSQNYIYMRRFIKILD